MTKQEALFSEAIDLWWQLASMWANTDWTNTRYARLAEAAWQRAQRRKLTPLGVEAVRP